MSEYALRLQNGQDTAARVRMADLLGLTPAGAVTARTGIRPAPTAGDVAVSAGTMNVTVQPFVAWVQGGISVAQGGYVFVLDAAKTLALGNGHASLSRTDVVAVVVKDDAYDGSGAYSATLTVVQGTPGAGVPALPSNCLPLRNVTVPAGLSAGTGGLTAGNLSTDRRTYVSGLGGVVTVASQAERDALPQQPGTLVYRKDTDVLQVRRAAGWSTLALDEATAWSNYTLASGFSVVAGHPTAGVRLLPGGMVASRGLLSASSTPLASNLAIATVPVGFRPSGIQRAAVQVVSSGGGDPAGVVEILTDGTVRLTSGPATAGNVLALSLMFTYPLT